MIATSSIIRPLIVALSGSLALAGAASMRGDLTRPSTHDNAAPSSLPPPDDEQQLSSRHPDDDDISREGLDRFLDKYRERKRQARLRRGLSAEETAAEKHERNLQRRREGLPTSNRKVVTGGDEYDSDGQRRRRRMAVNAGAGFLLSSVSPALCSEDPDDADVFLVAGVASTNNTEPEPTEALVMRDFFSVCNGCDVTTEAPEIYWKFTPDYGYETAQLAGLTTGDSTNKWFMDIKKYKKGKEVRINLENNQDPDQLWDFRPGAGTVAAPGPLSSFEDRTWRPPYEPTKDDLCVEPVFTNETKLQEFDTLELEKCVDYDLPNGRRRNDRRRLGNRHERRMRQVWFYCFSAIVCGDNLPVAAPDSLITLTCDQPAGGGTQCNQNTTLNVEVSKTNPNGFDGRTECANRPSIDEDQLSLQTTWFFVTDTEDINVNDFANVNVASLCNTPDSTTYGLETLIDIYQVDDNNNYVCITSQLLDCAADGNRGFDTQLLGSFQYLVYATGATAVEDCSDTTIDCK